MKTTVLCGQHGTVEGADLETSAPGREPLCCTGAVAGTVPLEATANNTLQYFNRF